MLSTLERGQRRIENRGKKANGLRKQNGRPVALYVRNDNRAARLVKLVATCGPLDIDDPQPAITVLLPDED